jgi:pimeloyl-ACP methyl ester carboxylesterase
VRIAWRRYGSGSETVLFIPTWNFVDSRVVRRQVDGLRDRFRLITYDARGSGESDHPRTGYRFDDHLADAIAVLDATNTPTASVIAASIGTHVAVLLAARDPSRLRRLVLIAPPMDVATANAVNRELDDGRDDAEGPDWRTDYERFVPWFISAVFPESGSKTTIDEIVAIALQADHDVLMQQSGELDWDAAPNQLGAVRCPTLVIDGAADGTLDLETVRAVAAAIPAGRLMLLDGLGHRPDISTPTVVNPILVDFLEADGGS